MKKNQGFTLIELLAVIIILGLIALVALPDVIKSTKNAKEKLYDTQIDLIKAGAVSYITDLIAHPENFDDTTMVAFRKEVINHNSANLQVTLKKLQESGAVDEDVTNPLCPDDKSYFDPGVTVVKINYDGKEFTYSVCSVDVDQNSNKCSTASEEDLKDRCAASSVN